MADVTAQFTVYKGDSPANLKHIVSVYKQSNFRDALQLVKQQPYNKNIFVNPHENKSIIEFLVTQKPLNIEELAPIVLLFFMSSSILTVDEFKEFNAMVNHFSKNNHSMKAWESKWASLEDNKFLNETLPYVELVNSRMKTFDYLDKNLDNWPLLLSAFFKSPVTQESHSMIAFDTNLLVNQ
tara:strand:- start:450 stop:995 length:546 start_codon:yes stop_codon:yes gene_type:complete